MVNLVPYKKFKLLLHSLCFLEIINGFNTDINTIACFYFLGGLSHKRMLPFPIVVTKGGGSDVDPRVQKQ